MDYATDRMYHLALDLAPDDQARGQLAHAMNQMDEQELSDVEKRRNLADSIMDFCRCALEVEEV